MAAGGFELFEVRGQGVHGVLGDESFGYGMAEAFADGAENIADGLPFFSGESG